MLKRLDEFMGEALTLYYNSKDPFGVDGDFITAPEISQLFGETIGVWAYSQWLKMGSPTEFNLVEIGPGRGTLMLDLLRATRNAKDFQTAAKIHLIETSEYLMNKQKQTLRNHQIEWHADISAVSTDIPIILIANEFFDALPIRQVSYDGQIWLEHFIDKNFQSQWVKSLNPPSKPTLPLPKIADIIEYSEIQSKFAKLMSYYTGAILIIDYGYEKSAYGDSLQALYKHKPCKFSDHFGHADITSHIDFEWLATHFKSCSIHTQRDFLLNNAIELRYKTLSNASLKSGFDRLIDNNKMGNLFKVLEIFNPLKS